MSEFVNTIDLLGDDAVADSLITRTITEFKDNMLTTIGNDAFAYCTALTEIDCPNITSIGAGAFRDCSNLVSANMPNANMYNAMGVFENCTLLRSFEHSGDSRQYGQSVFRNCTSLEEIVLRGNPGQTMFEKCTSLKKVDILWGNCNGYVFLTGATALKALILRKTDAIHTCGNAGALNGSTIASGTGYIYVPRALIDSYKVATNWSTHANQFRVLEDYTVDGTTTGELDESKI